ncbi:MAG: Bug family tripartite tricarboxylate transporter substrate binding protein [Burkholderiales bacterium]
MKIIRNFFSRHIAMAVMLGASSLALGQAASYPDKPIRIVNPFPPGSPVEFIGRQVADRLSKAFGKPVLLESRAGAGGTIGANFVAKSAPDGYTLLVTTPSTIAVAPSLYKVLPYDPVKDFVGVWSVMSAGLVVVVNPKIPATNLTEFLAFARANPGKVAYASSGVGTTQHLAAELFKTRTGLDLLHIPYKGGAPASADLMAGHVQVMFDALSNVRAAVLDGRLRALAVLRGKRARALPDVPTASEAGVNNVEQPGWVGVFAPTATPSDIYSKLVANTVKEMADSEVVARLMAAGNDNEYVVGPALTKKLAEDNVLFAEIVKRAGIQPE